MSEYFIGSSSQTSVCARAGRLSRSKMIVQSGISALALQQPWGNTNPLQIGCQIALGDFGSDAEGLDPPHPLSPPTIAVCDAPSTMGRTPYGQSRMDRTSLGDMNRGQTNLLQVIEDFSFRPMRVMFHAVFLGLVASHAIAADQAPAARKPNKSDDAGRHDEASKSDKSRPPLHPITYDECLAK
ncbi:MAG TPA: hypothetical protein VF258_11430, partial [Luteolibacter sp.]